MIVKSHRWQRTAVAAASFALLSLSGSGAYALSLGRLTVQSALGEPLRAEVEIPEITAEEASSLRAAVAQPEAFTAAGLEYSPALTSLQARLARRADGKAYLRLTSDRAVNDPFVDLILEASWSTGRVNLVASNGFSASYARSNHSVSASVIAGEAALGRGWRGGGRVGTRGGGAEREREALAS